VSRRRTTPTAPGRTEAGTTLVEVMMAVAILSIGIVSIVGAMGTSIIGTDHHRNQAQAHTVLLSAVDAVKAETYKTTCPATYNPATGVTLPAGWTPTSVSVTSIRYWDNSVPGFVSSCAVNSMLQLVDVQVASPNGRATESVAVVKRNPKWNPS
jgi:Tfp pilus assembly protein PilV